MGSAADTAACHMAARWLGDLVKKFPLKLNDSSGGLNDRDSPSALAPNEVSVLENYYTDNPGYLHKRDGKELIQYAPIDPQVFVSDGNTIGLWHLDELNTTDSALDAGPNAYDLTNSGGVSAVHGASSAAVLLPVGAPLGRQSIDAAVANPAVGPGNPDGTTLYRGVAAPLNNLPTLTVECWVNIPDTFTGQPITRTRNGNNFTFSNSGTHLFGSVKTGNNAPFWPGATVNGFRLWRGWDAVNGKNASDPYVTFELNTKGIPGTNTIVQSLYLPTGKMLHLRITYDSNTGQLLFYVNADLQATATVNGAGLVDDSNAGGLAAFGTLQNGYTGFTFLAKTAAGVKMDEMRISSIVRPTFPFKIPRGMGFEFAKSDGTRQAVISADDALYFTVGNGEWSAPMKAGMSQTAYWDAMFFNDILYLANGVDQPLAWNGTSLKDWGNPSIAAIANNSGSGSAVDVGHHLLVYTYLYGNYETGPSPAVDYISGGETIDLTSILPRHTNATGVRFYVTKAGGATYYLYRQIVHNPLAAMQAAGAFVSGGNYLLDTGGMGLADSALGTSNYPQMAASVLGSSLKNGKFLICDRARGFMCGMNDELYTLRWTEVGAMDVMRSFSLVNAAANKGPLTALASFYGEIQASKDGNATLVLRGDGPANWTELETLHPDVGAVDHWSYVRRYSTDSDRYTLCFLGRDFFYEYAGVSIQAISDKISGTFKGLAQNSSTRLAWTQTTQADFMAAVLNGGGGTANVLQQLYETDGIRQVPGRIQIVDQLDYLSLWGQGAPLVSGKIIAMAKGPAEGEFYFAQDGDNNLYRTADNFITKAVVAGGVLPTATDRIIELVYASIATVDTVFVFASDPVTESGSIYKWTNGAGIVLHSPGPFFWQADMPWRFDSSNFGDLYTGNASGINPLARTAFLGYTKIQQHNQNADGSFTDLFAQFVNPPNLFINHNQKIVMTPNIFNAKHHFGIWKETGLTTNSLNGFYAKTLRDGSILDQTYQGPTLIGNAVSSTILSFPVVAGSFYGMEIWTPTNDGSLRNPTFAASGTHRETSLAFGGNFRPQAIWDATGKLFFVAAGPENANGSRPSTLYSLTAAGGAPVAVFVPTNTQSCIAFASDGTNLWATFQNSAVGPGFGAYLAKINIATSVVTTVGALGGEIVPLRLQWNSVTNTLIGAGKRFIGYDLYNHIGMICKINMASGLATILKSLTAAGPTAAAPLEIAAQTTTPFSQFVAVNALGGVDTIPLFEVVSLNKSLLPAVTALPTPLASAFNSDAYEGLGASAAVNGIRTPLIFVPSSSSTTAGQYLWADRLYWYAPAAQATDGRLLQLGVPGTWEVRGTYVSQSHALGVFDAFDDLEVQYTGQINFTMWNDNNPGNLWNGAIPFTNGQPVTPNQRISVGAFNPVSNYVQWAAQLIQVYSIAAPTTTPEIDFVNVGYFLGSSNIPRVTGVHYKGRTYWAVSQSGQANNNLVLVFQKNRTWMKILGWNMKCMFMFRNQLVGMESAQFVRLESGKTDMGNIIRGRARTGYIMGFEDKMISGVQANVMAYINADFPNRHGYVKITPFRNNTPLPNGSWVFPIPDNDFEEVVRVKGVPDTSFGYAWARAFAIEIATSDDTTGPYQPVVKQPEEISGIDITLDVTGPSYNIPVS